MCGAPQVTVLALTGVQLSLGLVAPLGACSGWQLHMPGVLVQYGRVVWEGSLDALGKLSSQQTALLAVTKVSWLHALVDPAACVTALGALAPARCCANISGGPLLGGAYGQCFV